MGTTVGGHGAARARHDPESTERTHARSDTGRAARICADSKNPHRGARLHSTRSSAPGHVAPVIVAPAGEMAGIARATSRVSASRHHSWSASGPAGPRNHRDFAHSTAKIFPALALLDGRC